ncbi:hypothetical protein OH492_11975 [Vibrio chagasii]|nr:hypothetical protein [Vibrio chagasii]
MVTASRLSCVLTMLGIALLSSLPENNLVFEVLNGLNVVGSIPRCWIIV